MGCPCRTVVWHSRRPWNVPQCPAKLMAEAWKHSTPEGGGPFQQPIWTLSLYRVATCVSLCLTDDVGKVFFYYYYLFFPFTFLLYLPHATRDSHSFMHCVHVLLQSADHHDFLSGRHNWYATSHARPTYCNVCREALSGKIYDRPSFFKDFKIQKFKSPPRNFFFKFPA